MQLASSVNFQLLGLTKEASNATANGDINVVRVSVGAPKKTAMPVLQEQPSEDGMKSMPIFRQQDSAKGMKTMPLFRQKGSANELTSTVSVSVTQSSMNPPALTPVQQWVSTTSPEGRVNVVTAINNNNNIERKCDVTKAANETGSTFVTVEPLRAGVSPSSPSSPPPQPPPLPSTHIQLSRSVSLIRSSSNETTFLSAPNSPSSPMNKDRNYRPPQTRVDPFTFSRMINDGRRKLSNEAFSTSKSNGSSKSSCSSSCNVADRTLKSESLERRDADSATGASLPDTATEPSLPDDDASSDSVFR